MRPISIVLLTLAENTKGQIYWIALVVSLICIALAAALSGAALSTEARLLDTSTYFLMDVTLFLTGALLGSGIFAKDFSSRGLAEIVLVRGTSRMQLLFYRLSSHWISLLALGVIMLCARIMAFTVSGNFSALPMTLSLMMFVFASLKSILACAVAAWLGCVCRPTIAFLGTIGLFGIGHFSQGANGIAGLGDPNGEAVSHAAKILLNVFKFWNPNALVLDSYYGAWMPLGGIDISKRVGWGIAATLMAVMLGFLAVRSKNIESMKI